MTSPSVPSDCDPAVTNSNGDDTRHDQDIDWTKLGFALTKTDSMYISKCVTGEKFSQGTIVPLGNIEISPSAGVLNYGQGLFEGLKVYRREDGKIMMFRPEENALRMQMGADRLLMEAPSTDFFVEACKQTALANKRWVPPHGIGSLYLRPLLFGSGPVFGIGPAPEWTFLIFASPIGNFYKSLKQLNLFVEAKIPRAAPGGTGGVKSITNYAPVFEAVKEAKAKGFDDVLYLDAATGKYIEEVSSCNIFIVKDNVISTPKLEGTILPGITRKSIIELATDLGYEVKEEQVPIESAISADEVFCCGTAVIVTPVGSITYQDQRVEYNTGEETVCQKIRTQLTGIQTGLVVDNKGWTVQID